MDEQQDAGAFLEQIGAEVEAARRHAPCPLDHVGSELALDAAARERSLLQLAYAFGPAAHTASVRERAGVLLRVERLGPELHLEVSTNGPAYAARLLPQPFA